MGVYEDALQDLKDGPTLPDMVRLKFYTGSVSNSEFDDANVLTASGAAIWSKALIHPVRGLEGSREAVLIEQGKLTMSDKRVFIPGDVVTALPDGRGALKIGCGSPTINSENFLIPDGIIAYPPEGTIVYKKMYVRELSNGSFIGEM